MVKSCVFILTQNNTERKVYLKTTLYFLFKNFISKYNYDVIILHEGDYKDNDIEEIKLGIREECRHLLKFKKIDDDDFKIPEFINEEKLNNSINSKPVPYWRNIRYRMMCRWWIVNFTKYTEDYEYIMRLDDDAFIEEPLNNDLFKVVSDNDLDYVSNFVHYDCAICCYGMKEFFESIYPNKKDLIKKSFQDIPQVDKNNQNIKKLIELLEKNNEGEIKNLSMPIMYYNNFFVSKVSFWKSEEVVKLIDKIDKNGGIFYFRWGDAPLHTLIVSLLTSKTSRTIFKYSKKLQREVFKDDENNLHCYMPKLYSQSSCMLNK